MNSFSNIEETYGEVEGNRLLGLFDEKVILPILDPGARYSVQEMMGRGEVAHRLRQLESVRGAISSAAQLSELEHFTRGGLFDQAAAGKPNGLFGYYLLNDLGFFAHAQPWSDMIASLPDATAHEPEHYGMDPFHLTDFGWTSRMLRKYQVN